MYVLLLFRYNMRATMLIPGQANCIYIFAFKNLSVGATIPAVKALLSNIFFCYFCFLIAKIIRLGQQLIGSVMRICFHFFAYKNCNKKAAT